MALAQLASLKYVLGVAQSATPQNEQLQLYLDAATQTAKNYCKRNLEAAARTDYFDGTNTTDLPLRERPVWVYAFAGTLTSGSAVMTGIASTTSLAAGMPVSASSSATADPLPALTTILSVDSATQVTLSGNATRSGPYTLATVDVYADAGLAFGDGTTTRATSNRLFLGKDYALVRDAADGSSRSGLLRRLGASISGSPAGWPWPGDGSGAGRGSSLTARALPGWPRYTAGGGYAVSYYAGYLPGAIPADLSMAVIEIAAWMKRCAPLGGVFLQHEKLRDYDYQIGQLAMVAPELGGARQILSRYREQGTGLY